MRAAVVGAGVFGLAAATELAERGFAVTLYERNPGLGGNASWLAGGMLAPFCEGESASPDVVERGQRAVEWWARHAPVTRNGTLVLAPPRDAPDLDRFAQRTQGWQRLDEAAIGSLEPDLAERFRQGLWFAGEGHVDAREAMNALCQRLIAKGAELRFGQPFPGAPHNGVIVDCRGYTARDALPQLRGVRGEMLLLQSHELTLRRPVRLLHPRLPLYVVPRGEGLYMVGATSIESSDAGEITARSALELLSAAYALHPAFGEARIVEMSSGVRPAFEDNLPRIVRHGHVWYVNGLYRHGFLIAPALATRLATMVLEGHDVPALQGRPCLAGTAGAVG